MKLLYFGQIAEWLEKDSETIEGIEELAALDIFLKNKYSVLQNKTFTYSVNQKICTEANLDNTSEVALLPPFSGG